MTSVLLSEFAPGELVLRKKKTSELKATAVSRGIPEVIILLNEVMEKCYTFSPETPDPKSAVLPGDVPHFSKQSLNVSVKFLLSR